MRSTRYDGRADGSGVRAAVAAARRAGTRFGCFDGRAKLGTRIYETGCAVRSRGGLAVVLVSFWRPPVLGRRSFSFLGVGDGSRWIRA